MAGREILLSARRIDSRRSKISQCSERVQSRREMAIAFLGQPVMIRSQALSQPAFDQQFGDTFSQRLRSCHARRVKSHPAQIACLKSFGK